eukprot:UN09949
MEYYYFVQLYSGFVHLLLSLLLSVVLLFVCCCSGCCCCCCSCCFNFSCSSWTCCVVFPITIFGPILFTRGLSGSVPVFCCCGTCDKELRCVPFDCCNNNNCCSNCVNKCFC